MNKGLKRLDDLEPNFKRRIEELLSVIPLPVMVVSGRRTIAEQNKLYAQGRTTAGNIVTKAKGGQSAHNFGEAVDLCPLDSKGDLNWDDKEGFAMIATCAEDMGLVSGAFFKSIVDFPHVESCNWRDRQAAWKRGEINVA